MRFSWSSILRYHDRSTLFEGFHVVGNTEPRVVSHDHDILRSLWVLGGRDLVESFQIISAFDQELISDPDETLSLVTHDDMILGHSLLSLTEMT